MKTQWWQPKTSTEVIWQSAESLLVFIRQETAAMFWLGVDPQNPPVPRGSDFHLTQCLTEL